VNLRRLRWFATGLCALVSLVALWPLSHTLLRTFDTKVDAEAVANAHEQIEAAFVTFGAGQEPKEADIWLINAPNDPKVFSKTNVQIPWRLLFGDRESGFATELFRQGGVDYLAAGRITKKGEGIATVIELSGSKKKKSEYHSFINTMGLLWFLSSGAIGWWLAGRVIQPARQALSERRGFLADAAHEMRTPLSIILASASQSLARPRSSEEYVRSLAEIRAAAERASAGVNELLDLARLESGQAMPRLAPLRLDLLAEEVAASTRADDVVVTAAPGTAAVVVDADLSLLRQAVDNLVRNAVRRSKNVSLDTSIDGRDGVLTVSDDGPGFDEAMLPHVFERFRRGDSRGEVGLGLALVQTIVAAHGGVASAANRPQGGAAVTLRIPLTRNMP
jgi:two-component system, OmpR family, sensor kinase